MFIQKCLIKIILVTILILSSACSFFNQPQNDNKNVENTTPTLENSEPYHTATSNSEPEAPPSPTGTSSSESKDLVDHNISDLSFRRLWASEGISDLLDDDPEAVFGPPDAFECNDRYSSWYNQKPENSPNEFFLNLQYAYAIVPSEINVVISGNPGGNLRIELINSSSGLGLEIFDGLADTKGKCPGTFTIPVDTDLYLDTVILSFRNTDQPMYIDAVEMVGSIPDFLDIPVFWRIPIPADSLAEPESDFPGGLATDPFGNIYVANGNNGLARYDVEGNLLQQYSVPNESNIRDVAINNQGRIFLSDLVYKWYVTLDQDGVQVDAGGEDFGWNGPREIAVHPTTGDIYLLDETDEFSRIRVYSPINNQLIRDINLDSIGLQIHKGLAFDQEGYLYTIDQTQAVILVIDSETGEVVDHLGHSVLRKASPSDLAIDDNGNIYVLLNASPDDSAVYILDQQGFLKNRLGNLTYDGSNWVEGVFFFPVSISISPDGRFLSICENGFLTTYLLEFEN
ncbi:MAG TPA: NHL repeat-containing protein [Anaerolineaceae bacterium]|nr:NHL repeat-containing protein [Anaerolineaceae bacterium]